MTPPLPARADVVIIGGGIVGCSIAYHLTRLGITDVLLLERRQLTCGTTWHAAGLIGQLRATRRMTELAKYTSELLHALEAETGQATGFKQNGSISLALNAERFEELKRGASMAKNFGLAVEVIGPAEIKARYPLLEVGDAVGGVFLPKDGQANPIDTTQAFAKGARQRGARIVEGVKVERILVEQGRAVGVMTDQGPVAAVDRRARRRHVVARAGRRRRRLGAAARGRALLHRHRAPGRGAARPAGAAGHRRVHLLQGGRRQAPGRRLRAGGQALGHGRHPRGVLLRQPARGHGPFRADPGEAPRAACRSWPPPASRPSSTARRASPPTTATSWARPPSCATCSSPTGFNSIGIQSSGGAGKVLAEWIRDRRMPVDLTDVDVRRLHPFQSNRTYLRDRTTETLGLLYAMHWPYRQYATARGVRRSPFHDRLVAAGAVMGETAGWERPNWYAPPGVEPEYRYSWGRQNWFEHTAAECRAVRDAVALFDQSSFAKFLVEGSGRLRRAEPALRGRDGRARRPDRLHPVVQRAGRHRGRPHRHPPGRDQLPRRHRRRRPDPRPRLAAASTSRPRPAAAWSTSPPACRCWA